MELTILISGLRIFHSYGDITIVGERLLNLGRYACGPRRFNLEGSLSCYACFGFSRPIQRTALFTSLLGQLEMFESGRWAPILTRIWHRPHTIGQTMSVRILLRQMWVCETDCQLKNDKHITKKYTNYIRNKSTYLVYRRWNYCLPYNRLDAYSQ
jgi:hypothetical protein